MTSLPVTRRNCCLKFCNVLAGQTAECFPTGFKARKLIKRSCCWGKQNDLFIAGMLSGCFCSCLHGLLKCVMLANIYLAFNSLCKDFLGLSIKIAVADIF